MRAEFLIENIEKFLPILNKILPTHSQIPVLSNLLIETKGEGIFISATNLEIGIKIKISGKIEEEGATTVPGKQFIEALSSFPKDKVTLSLEKDALKLRCRDNTISFQTIAKEEFPTIYGERGEEACGFLEGEIENIFFNIIFAASLDDTRPELTGVLLSQMEDGMNFVATDGFRLSLKRVKNKKILIGEPLILPARIIGELMGLAGSVTMYVHSKVKQVMFEAENMVLVGRLISNQFPNYEKVIPKNGKTKILLDVEEFVQKLRLAAIFARDSANIVKLTINEGKLLMQTRASGVGEGEIELAGKQEGEANEIAFNIKFLMDLLKNIKAKEISMQVTSPVEPALFTISEDEDFLHIIMPVRVQE